MPGQRAATTLKLVGIRSQRCRATRAQRDHRDHQHEHKAGRFDPDQCRACAKDAGLLDHYERVQLHERALVAARGLAWQAQRYAIVTMYLPGLALVGAVIALLVAVSTG